MYQNIRYLIDVGFDTFVGTIQTIIDFLLNRITSIFQSINGLFTYIFNAIDGINVLIDQNSGYITLINTVYNAIPVYITIIFIFGFVSSIIFLFARRM